MRNKTSGTTLGKSNYAAYAAFPDRTNASQVNVLGYQQLYFISPQPTCCKATLTLEEFRRAFEGTYLFTQIDSSWMKVNATTFEKIGKDHLGYPCSPSEHSSFDMSFSKTGLPAWSQQVQVDLSPAGPGGPATCTSRKESLTFSKVSTDGEEIAKEAKAAYTDIVGKCGNSPNSKCYF
jgi:hypothetical protein